MALKQPEMIPSETSLVQAGDTEWGISPASWQRKWRGRGALCCPACSEGLDDACSQGNQEHRSDRRCLLEIMLLR